MTAVYDSLSASAVSTTKLPPRSGAQLLVDHVTIDSHRGLVDKGKHTSSQSVADTQTSSAAGAQLATDQNAGAHQHGAVGGDQQGPAASSILGATPSVATRSLLDPMLTLAAEALDDLESSRIANQNRLRSLRDVYGMVGTPQEAAAQALVDGLAALEHQAELELKRALRRHPLGAWVKATPGIGEKQGARLLASIGDPYWNSLHDRPRLVSELWSYAGLGDAARQVRRRGQQSNWNADVKMRAWLVSVSCVKSLGSPYRTVYDEGRAKCADAVHREDCKRCGPSGKPALAGSPLSAGHQHARALRLISKAILRDLWAEAKGWHEAGQP